MSNKASEIIFNMDSIIAKSRERDDGGWLDSDEFDEFIELYNDLHKALGI